MSKTKICVISIVVLFVILVVGYLCIRNYPEVVLSADRSEYAEGEYPKINIANKTASLICFSSCYPFFLEKDEDGWAKYNYPECKKEDMAGYCIDAGKSKTFEIVTPYAEPGVHRVKVNVCLDCKDGQSFVDGGDYYSNSFRITNF